MKRTIEAKILFAGKINDSDSRYIYCVVWVIVVVLVW